MKNAPRLEDMTFPDTQNSVTGSFFLRDILLNWWCRPAGFAFGVAFLDCGLDFQGVAFFASQSSA